jgi:hypothetical protein
MGNPAIDHTQSKLVVSDGKAYVHLFFGPMAFSGQTGYLQEISKFETRHIDDGILDVNKSTLTPATVISEWENVTDSYGPTKKEDQENGKWYPKEVAIEVTPGETYTYVYVNVPVMAPTSNQPARLKIDWSGFLGINNLETDDLEAAVSALGSVNSASYTANTHATLTASIAAANELLNLTNATQPMIDARLSALGAAKTALILKDTVTLGKATGAVTVTAPTVVGGKTELSVDAAAINTALTTAASSSAGGAGAPVIVEIAINAAPEKKTGLIEAEVTLPVAGINTVLETVSDASSGYAGASIVVDTGIAKVSLDSGTLQQIADKIGDSSTNAEVTIAVAVGGGVELTSAQAATVGTKQAFTVAIDVAGAPLSGLDSPITVTVPYAKTSGSDKTVVVYYVPATGGTPTKFSGANVTYVNGEVSFKTSVI